MLVPALQPLRRYASRRLCCFALAAVPPNPLLQLVLVRLLRLLVRVLVLILVLLLLVLALGYLPLLLLLPLRLALLLIPELQPVIPSVALCSLCSCALTPPPPHLRLLFLLVPKLAPLVLCARCRLRSSSALGIAILLPCSAVVVMVLVQLLGPMLLLIPKMPSPILYVSCRFSCRVAALLHPRLPLMLLL